MRLVIVVVFLGYVLLLGRIVTLLTLLSPIIYILLLSTFLFLYYISLNPLPLLLCHIPPHQHHLHPLPFQPFLFLLNKPRQQLPRQVPSPYFLYLNCTFSHNIIIILKVMLVPVTDKTLAEPSGIVLVLLGNVSFSFLL
jgi:hypothetical protein